VFPYDNSKENPYHLSVGSLLINHRGELLTLQRPDGFIILPTGTLKPKETLEDALHRELMEETGAKGRVKRYLGVTLMPFRWGGRPGSPLYHKAMLWHEIELLSIDDKLRAQNDDESESSVLWLPKDKATERFQRQGRELDDWDFSEAVARLS
jgi:8-oxo-dGTP pyrophosphatase MutT (NUDIX family)